MTHWHYVSKSIHWRPGPIVRWPRQKKQNKQKTKLFYPLTVCRCKDDLSKQRQIFLQPNTLGRFWMSGQQMFLLPCWHHKLCAHNRVTNFVVFPSLLVCELRPFQSAGQKCSGERRRKKNFSPTSIWLMMCTNSWHVMTPQPSPSSPCPPRYWNWCPVLPALWPGALSCHLVLNASSSRRITASGTRRK